MTKNQNDKLLLTESCGEKAASRRSDNGAYELTHSHRAAAVTPPSIPGRSRRFKLTYEVQIRGGYVMQTYRCETDFISVSELSVTYRRSHAQVL